MPRPSTSLGLSRSSAAFDGVRPHATPVPMNAPSWVLPLATTALLQQRASTPTQQRQRIKRSASSPDAAAHAAAVLGVQATDNQALWPATANSNPSSARPATVHSTTHTNASKPADLHSSVQHFGFAALDAQQQQWPVHSRAIVAQRAGANVGACSGCDAVRESLKRARAESRELRSLVFKLETAAMQGTAYSYGNRAEATAVIEHTIVNRMYTNAQSSLHTASDMRSGATVPSKRVVASDAVAAASTAAAVASTVDSDIAHAVAAAKVKWEAHTQQLLAAKTASLQQFITQQECQLSDQRQQHERHCFNLTRQHTVAQEKLRAEHSEQLLALQQQCDAQIASAQQQAVADCQQQLEQVVTEHAKKESVWQLQVAELQAQLQVQQDAVQALHDTTADLKAAAAIQQQSTNENSVCSICAQNTAAALEANNNTYDDSSTHASSQQSDAGKLMC
jgi:trimeric autotransporter adhesin